MIQKNSLERISISGLVIFHVIGIAGYLFFGTQMFVLAWLNLLVSFFLLILPYGKAFFFSNWPVFLLTFLLGIIIEIVGVHTGFPFGTYHYGNSLGIKFLSVPIVIGLNWTMLSFAVTSLWMKFPSKWLATFAGAVTLTLLDLLMEPLAPQFDFWVFSEGLPPIRNFVSWFIFSFVLCFLWRRTVINYNRIALFFIIVQYLFFGILLLLNNF